MTFRPSGSAQAVYFFDLSDFVRSASGSAFWSALLFGPWEWHVCSALPFSCPWFSGTCGALVFPDTGGTPCGVGVLTVWVSESGNWTSLQTSGVGWHLRCFGRS